MDYEAEGAADVTTPGRLGLASSAEGQALVAQPSGTYDIEGLSPVISLQVAARAARYAIRPGSISKGFGRGESDTTDIQEDREIEAGERVSLGRAFNLMLAFALGVAVYAGVMYVILGTQLHSPPPSATLPPPGATA
jgi:hypothetical protein